MTEEEIRIAALKQTARYIDQRKWLEKNNFTEDLHRLHHEAWVVFCNQLSLDIQRDVRALWWNEFVR